MLTLTTILTPTLTLILTLNCYNAFPWRPVNYTLQPPVVTARPASAPFAPITVFIFLVFCSPDWINIRPFQALMGRIARRRLICVGDYERRDSSDLFI